MTTTADVPELALDGRNVVLRPIRQQDYDLIRQAEMNPEIAGMWRHRGATPSPEAYAESLWSGVLAQFIVIDKARMAALGLVAVHDASFPNRFAHFSAARFSLEPGPPLFIQGVCVFLDYVFAAWDFKKLYSFTTDRSLAHFRSGLGEVFVEEGRLRDHSYFGGQWWDEVILAIYADRWSEVSAYAHRAFAATAR